MKKEDGVGVSDTWTIQRSNNSKGMKRKKQEIEWTIQQKKAAL